MKEDFAHARIQKISSGGGGGADNVFYYYYTESCTDLWTQRVQLLHEGGPYQNF